MNDGHGTKKEILKQAWIYSAGTQLTQLITLAAAILSRRFLGPAQTGIWSALQIIVDYSKYATLGTMDAASREIPTALGRGDGEKADRIKNLTFTFISSSSLIIAAMVFTAAWVARPWLSREIFFGLCFVAAVIFLQRINNLLVATLRCYKKFHIEARFMLISAVVNAVLVALLTYYFKIYGFIWALILSFIFNISYLHVSYSYQFRWIADWKQMKPLMNYGLPLMILGVTVTVLKSLDKILIAKMLGFESLGFYSIALMACSYLGNFSISIAVVLLPYSQERYGRSENGADLCRFILKSSKAYALALPLLIGMAWFFVPLAVWLVLPKFAPGILSMKILTLSLFFLAQLQPFHDYLITIKRHSRLLILISILTAAAFAGDFTAIRMGLGIEGVAAATVLIFFIYFSAVFFMARRYFTGNFRCVTHYVKVCAVFLYMTGTLIFLQGNWLKEGEHDIFFYIGRIFIFLVAYLPLGWLLEREFHISGVVLRKITPQKDKQSSL